MGVKFQICCTTVLIINNTIFCASKFINWLDLTLSVLTTHTKKIKIKGQKGQLGEVLHIFIALIMMMIS